MRGGCSSPLQAGTEEARRRRRRSGAPGSPAPSPAFPGQRWGVAAGGCWWQRFPMAAVSPALLPRSSGHALAPSPNFLNLPDTWTSISLTRGGRQPPCPPCPRPPGRPGARALASSAGQPVTQPRCHPGGRSRVTLAGAGGAPAWQPGEGLGGRRALYQTPLLRKIRVSKKPHAPPPEPRRQPRWPALKAGAAAPLACSAVGVVTGGWQRGAFRHCPMPVRRGEEI